jgi:hypothetical protein
MIKVGSEPIKDVLFLVTDVVATHFSGKVTNTKGEPIPGAKVAVSYKHLSNEDVMKELWVSSEQSVTDLEGLFKVAIYGCDFPMDLQFEISSSEGYKVPSSYSLPDKNGMSYYVDEYYRVERSGVVTVIGGTGESYSDLHITMADKSNRTLYVKLLSDDTMDERSVSLKVFQNSILLHHQFIDDGYFKIEGVNPGLLQLDIIPYAQNNIVTPYDTHVLRKYLRENIDLDILDSDQEEIYAEIQLRESGYLWGVIADTNNTPVHQVLVNVNGELFNDHISVTDERGYFFINELSMEDICSLECYDYSTREQIYQQTGIMPNQEDIHIQLGE